MEPSTFIELYKFLQKYPEKDIRPWLKNQWDGKEKQESILRLFGGLDCIAKFSQYNICKGNFNKKTITPHASKKDAFYDEKGIPIKLKDKGDSSDLTGMHEEDHKHLLVTTSKNLNKTQVGKLDIDKILTNWQQYQEDGYRMSLCVCVRSSVDFDNMKRNMERTNRLLKQLLEREDTIVIDWDDLNDAYHQFKLSYGEKSLDMIVRSNKKTLCFKMHQRLGIMKTLRMKDCLRKREILWGHIQRSGKSYIIAGCIVEDSKHKDECNYLIMTTAPNETLDQQTEVLDCTQLCGFNIETVKGGNKQPLLGKKNIILCSKQFLQTKNDDGEEKTNSVAWLKKVQFDMRFIDESHNGGTTELARKTLDTYGKDAFTVQITATYSKPINDYSIPRDCWILWDLEDIKLCRNIKDEESITRLAEKHGECILEIRQQYSDNSIVAEYSEYPELCVLTNRIKPDVVSEIIDATRDNDDGWSAEACFLLNQYRGKPGSKKPGEIQFHSEFQNEEENLKLWHMIFGKTNKYGSFVKDYPPNIVFMERIKTICHNTGSRFIGEGDFHGEPMIIMAFLPQTHICKISKATKKLLEMHNVIPDYDIISINGATTKDPKQEIEDARDKARLSNKKGVLVLSGKQCSLGVSIKNCDIVLLLNKCMSYDIVYQMMFRCMTQGKKKKCGFVVDLNIQRVIRTSIVDYASLIKPNLHPKEAIKYILQERLINLNADHWMPSFGNSYSMIDTLCESIYEKYSSDVVAALDHYLNRLIRIGPLLTKEVQELFNAMFSSSTPTKQKKFIDEILGDDEGQTIKEGIEKIACIDDTSDTTDTSSSASCDSKEETQERNVNYMEILKQIMPLICLFTIRNDETSFAGMFRSIESDEYVFNLLVDQAKIWWKSIDAKSIKSFVGIYMEYMSDDKEANQIIRTVKELFRNNIGNYRELSRLIDKYLIPQEAEKKSNAEVSTPFRLRQYMLATMPAEFWKSLRKVFEPCAGKGGFLIDIIDKFMEGLKESIPDAKLRYKTIVEECLYFSDINPTNIFICKLLIDPHNEYKLNYNVGDTLELNIQEKWGIEGFDAVIGNPPYQVAVGPKKTQPIWNLFTKKWLDELLYNGYLLFVHPSGWRESDGVFRDVYTKIRSKNLIYLNMNDFKKGQEVFKQGTNFDYYLVQNNSNQRPVEIVDIYDKTHTLDLSNWPFIPGGGFELFEKSLARDGEERVNVLHDWSSYETRKKWMSKERKDEYQHPCSYTITMRKGVTCYYSSEKKGHFDIPKVIWSNGAASYPVIDETGKYALTQFSYAVVDETENLGNIKRAMESERFLHLMTYVNVGHRYNYKVIGMMKKDFWKEFI